MHGLLPPSRNMELPLRTEHPCETRHRGGNPPLSLSAVHICRFRNIGVPTPTLIGEIALDVQLFVRDWVKKEVVWVQDVAPWAVSMTPS